MARYVTLVNWTPQGAATFRNTLDRASAANELFGSLGGSMVEIYWTLGPYDIVAIGEFPDDEAATAAMLRLGEQGNVRTTTMRAFDRDEMTGIVNRAGG